MSSLPSVRVFCPAKINLSLAVHGKRGDGFHSLSSVVCPLGWGDWLETAICAGDGPDTLEVDTPEIPCDQQNLVLQAAAQVRGRVRLPGRLHFRLQKSIPAGAGLGGGSSNAVGALKCIQQLFPDETAGLPWIELAAELGSDCPIFWQPGLTLMQGRGEVLSRLPDPVAERINGLELAVFKPPFGIATPDAYRRLAAAQLYTDRQAFEQQTDSWVKGTDMLPPPCNDFQRLVERWIPSLAVVLATVNGWPGCQARLSGSGSACFAVLSAGRRADLAQFLLDSWGNRKVLLVHTHVHSQE